MPDPTYATARLAMLLYALALAGILTTRRCPQTLWLTRLGYTAGCAVLLVHIAIAFHRQHHWSHAAAHAHVEQQTEKLTGFATGAGLWLNYLFAVAWVVDVVWWWAAGTRRYRERPAWIAVTLHAFLLFMAVNASIVFATGPVRLAGIGVVGLLVVCAVYRLVRGGRTQLHDKAPDGGGVR